MACLAWAMPPGWKRSLCLPVVMSMNEHSRAVPPRSRPRSTDALAESNNEANNSVGALSRSLDVIEMVMGSAHPPSAAQITKALNLPRPTTNRIIGNLVRMNFLKRDPLERELIEGDRLLNLALAVIMRATQRGPRHEVLRELSLRTEETCNVGAIAGGRVRYVDRVETHWPLTLRLDPGSEIPLHCSALGKLLMALLPLAQRQKYLKALTLTRYTDNTITDVAALKAELDCIGTDGFSIDNEEYLPGVCGLAVPVPNPNGLPILGLAIAAPSARVTVEELRSHLPLMREFATRLAVCY